MCSTESDCVHNNNNNNNDNNSNCTTVERRFDDALNERKRRGKRHDTANGERTCEPRQIVSFPHWKMDSPCVCANGFAR